MYLGLNLIILLISLFLNIVEFNKQKKLLWKTNNLKSKKTAKNIPVQNQQWASQYTINKPYKNAKI